MTTKTKDAIIVTIVMLGGIGIAVGDLHRVILRAVWPYLTAYFDWLFL